jgi:uncharacterized protein YndB with AHSA1/START domain
MSVSKGDSNRTSDREIVLSRVIDAPQEQVFLAWANPKSIFKWFGPRGYHCEVHQICEATSGAVWRFDMISPTGMRFDNRIIFLEVSPYERLVFNHGKDIDEDPGRFNVKVSFDQQRDGKTLLTLRQLHPSKAQRDDKIGFGAIELGQQTLAKLEEFLHGC